MNSFNAKRHANQAEVEKCYTRFTQLVAAVADRHQRYLLDQGLAIADCYHLTFTYAKAWFQVQPKLPQLLYEELRQCYMESFGQSHC